MTKTLMIQGTGSGAGKSLVAAALCRVFNDEGVNVAPFKAQNMALNSCITGDGGEMGRAQVLQAEACRTLPTVDMNPVLLKASGDMGSQVIIHGKALRHMKAQEYYAFRETAWEAVRTSFLRLSRQFDLIILEGAGSPAEINLMDVDIVNMAAARLAKAPVLLVGDIDKGGVFASLFGTVRLLGRHSRLVKGFIINKFRGDVEILNPGLEMIAKKTGRPVIGVLPYVTDLGLPEEDGLGLTGGSSGNAEGAIRIVVVRLRYISNFTDFDPLMYEPDVQLIYSTRPSDIESADMIILPGSKNTVKDLLFLRENGLDESVRRAHDKGATVAAICGGYQMAGRKIYDPECVESNYREIDGLGLLNIDTLFEKTKTTCQVEAEMLDGKPFGVYRCGGPSHSFTGEGADIELKGGKAMMEPLLKGYEIHMGESKGEIGLFRVRRLSGPEQPGDSSGAEVLDGSARDNCWGTYLHGLFENDGFRRGVLDQLRGRKGLAPIDATVSYRKMRDQAIDRLADMVRQNLDLDFVRRIVGL